MSLSSENLALSHLWGIRSTSALAGEGWASRHPCPDSAGSSRAPHLPSPARPAQEAGSGNGPNTQGAGRLGGRMRSVPAPPMGRPVAFTQRTRPAAHQSLGLQTKPPRPRLFHVGGHHSRLLGHWGPCARSHVRDPRITSAVRASPSSPGDASHRGDLAARFKRL